MRALRSNNHLQRLAGVIFQPVQPFAHQSVQGQAGGDEGFGQRPAIPQLADGGRVVLVVDVAERVINLLGVGSGLGLPAWQKFGVRLVCGQCWHSSTISLCFTLRPTLGCRRIGKDRGHAQGVLCAVVRY